MAITALRPVGNRILPLGPATRKTLACATRYRAYWLNSGTAALALAIIAAKINRTVTTPEVILPTYGCPDLVAAAEYAGTRAVLVDTQIDSPHFDYAQLQAAISPSTVAIVAPTLLGIRAIEAPLRDAIGSRPITLIEDSAQWYPRDSTQTFFGDYVVLSFGRGKPINLLGGGVLLTPDRESATLSGEIEQAGQVSSTAMIKQRLRAYAYNALIHPLAFGIAEKLPFLHIGETVYHKLATISAMPELQQRLFEPNMQAFTQRNLAVQQQWRAALANLRDERVVDLCVLHDVPAPFSLLRYPVLIKSKPLRDELYARLRQAGLGASTMYARPLYEIPGVAARAALFAEQNRAKNFADNLITLPTHDAVTTDIIATTIAIMRNTLQLAAPFKSIAL